MTFGGCLAVNFPGFFDPKGFSLLTFLRQESVPAGMGAVTTAPGTYGFAALFLLSGAMELAVWTQVAGRKLMIG